MTLGSPVSEPPSIDDQPSDPAPAERLEAHATPLPITSLDGGGGGGFSLGGVHYIQARHCHRDDRWVRVQVTRISPEDIVMVDASGLEHHYGLPRGPAILEALGVPADGLDDVAGLVGHLADEWHAAFLTGGDSLHDLGERPTSSFPVNLSRIAPEESVDR